MPALGHTVRPDWQDQVRRFRSVDLQEGGDRRNSRVYEHHCPVRVAGPRQRIIKREPVILLGLYATQPIAEEQRGLRTFVQRR